MSEPTTFQAIRKLRDLRYVLLAGTLMSALALPQWGFARDSDGDGRIIVAQREDPKDKNKGKQPQKGPPPGQQSGPKQGGQQGQAGQQKQIGKQPTCDSAGNCGQYQ